MGQAFDKEGKVLGDAYGETKAEVFSKLNEAYPDAHEIQIRKMRDIRDKFKKSLEENASLKGIK